MKIHLIFCCSKVCAQKEMSDLVNSTPKYQCTVKYPDTVLIGDVRYIFMVDINHSPERIYGFLPESFRTCSEYDLDPKILSYLEARLATNQPVQPTS